MMSNELITQAGFCFCIIYNFVYFDVKDPIMQCDLHLKKANKLWHLLFMTYLIPLGT